MQDFTLDPATTAWSVYNIFRDQGLTAQADIATYWETAWETGLASVTSLDYATLVAEGFALLEAGGFVTIVADELVATQLDSAGKPARLRRTDAAENAPLDLEFTEAAEVAYFDVQPSSLVWLTEPFTTDTGQFNIIAGSGFALSGGAGVSTHSSETFDLVSVDDTPDALMPQLCVTVDITAQSGGAQDYDVVGVGIAKDSNNSILAMYDRIAGEVRVETTIGGSFNFNAADSGNTFTVPFSMALAIVANSCVVWVKDASTWEKITSFDITSRVDMKALDLTGWKPAVAHASKTTASWSFDNLKAGRFGGVGLRDITIVTHEDGGPHIESDSIQFLATATDPSGTGYMGVFTFDLVGHTIAQNGAIMVSRDGATQNDLAGHLIWYANGDRRLFISTWGNGIGGTLEILHTLETGADLLTGSNVVEDMTALALQGVPGAPAGAYDPFAIKFGSTWFIAYTVTEDTDFSGDPFYPALDSSADLSTFTNVGDDVAAQPYEGTRLFVADDALWLATGTYTSARLYDSSMSFVGDLDVTFDGSGGLPVHPMVFPNGDKQVILTFDNTRFDGVLFTIGNVKLYEADRFQSESTTGILEFLPAGAQVESI